MDLGSLTKKKGPLPVWAWALIASIILFLLYRHFKGSRSSSISSADTSTVDPETAASDSSGGSLAGGSFGGSSGDLSGNVASLPTDSGNGSIFTDPGLPNTGVDETVSTPAWLDGTDPFADPAKGVSNPPIPAPLSSPAPTNGKVPAAKPAAKPVTHPPLKSIIPGIKGKVISQKVLPNGAKLVTLQGGRKIEQAKGKKAYVVKK